jgi:poly(hydroxyalkanoate) granule-associated protein
MPQVENGGDGGRTGWIEQVRRVLLAGVGAVFLNPKEVEEFVDRLVRKGEMAEKDGRRLVSDILDQRRKDVTQRVAAIPGDVHSAVEKVLHKMKLVSKSDIEELKRRLDELSHKLDELEAGSRK